MGQRKSRMKHLLATKAIKESHESHGLRDFMVLASMTPQEVTSSSLTTSSNATSLRVPSMDRVPCFYNPYRILTHACYGLKKKCSPGIPVLNVCSHLVALCGEAGEPAGGEVSLAESRLLETQASKG